MPPQPALPEARPELVKTWRKRLHYGPQLGRRTHGPSAMPRARGLISAYSMPPCYGPGDGCVKPRRPDPRAAISMPGSRKDRATACAN
jgi:hypothetical protein